MPKNIKQILKDKSNDYSKLEKNFFNKTGKSLIFDNCSVENKENSKTLSASIVIPAFNAEDTILICLSAIERSSFNLKYPGRLQVVITDDGSTDNTYKLLKESKFNLNLTVVHQKNHGQGPAMNAAISVATGDIIIEVDADTILNFYAIENLMARHQFHKDALYTGFRFYVNENFPKVNLNYIKKNGPDSGFYLASDERIKFPEPGWPDNMNIISNHFKNLGNSKGLWMGNDDNDDPWILADMVFGMLFSLPRNIFNTIGGFDDRFEGWGCDDGYVGAKAISEGVYVIPVYTATAFHISHPFRTIDKQSEYDFNRKFFFEFINSTAYKGHPDWIAKARNRITSKFTLKNINLGLDYSSKKKVKREFVDTEYLLNTGRYKEAYTNISKEKNRDIQHFINLSKALRGINQYKKTVKVLENLIKDKEYINEDILFQLAMAHSSIGNFTKARSLLKKISEIKPNYPELSYWLYRDPKANFRQGIKYFKEELYEGAQRCFEAVLLSKPDDNDALIYRKKCIKKITSHFF